MTSRKEELAKKKAARKAARAAEEAHLAAIRSKLKTAKESRPKLVLSKAKAGDEPIVLSYVHVDDLSKAMKDALFELLKANMEVAYNESGPEWTWVDSRKRAEVFDQDARFILLHKASSESPSTPATTTSTEASEATTQENKDGAPVSTTSSEPVPPAERTEGLVGFACFRYDEEDDDLLLFLYEIQMAPEWTGKGLGKAVMTNLELLGLKTGMDYVQLTVFHNNPGAMRFYLRLGYKHDVTSPIRNRAEYIDNPELDTFEILSKIVNPALKKIDPAKRGADERELRV